MINNSTQYDIIKYEYLNIGMKYKYRNLLNRSGVHFITSRYTTFK